jgi:hypothetical protein
MTADDLDPHLRAYFTRHRPPTLALPTVPADPVRRREPGRAALALGLGGLLLVGLLATDRPTPPRRPTDPGPSLLPGATADGASLLRTAATPR